MAAGLQKRTRRKALQQFGINTDYLFRWKRLARLRYPQSEAELDATFAEMRTIREREKNPPEVAPSDGWSPYAAATFLSSAPFKMGDYHWSFDDEWTASSETYSIGKGLFKNAISYYVEGHELAATTLKLRVGIDVADDSDDALDLFCSLAQLLLLKAVPGAAHKTALGNIRSLTFFERCERHLRIAFQREDLELMGPLEGAYRLTLHISCLCPLDRADS